MKRILLCLSLLALCLGLSAPAQAASYPSKPITLVNPFGAGTGLDLIVRPVVPFIKEALGTEIVTDYKTGAAGIVGANYFMTRRPDGYNMLVYNQPHIIMQEMFMNTSYKSADLIPVLGVTYRPDFLIVRLNDERFKTAQDVVAYATANPGKLTVGTTGVYSGNHLTYALFEKSTGLNMVRVPFESGGKMLAALLGGQVDVVLSGYLWVPTYEGQLKALASSTRERLVPDVPTMGECGIEGVVDSANSSYFFMHKNTPEPIINYLREKLAPLVHSEALKQAMIDANMRYDYAVFDWKQCAIEIDRYRDQIAKVKDLLKESEDKK